MRRVIVRDGYRGAPATAKVTCDSDSVGVLTRFANRDTGVYACYPPAQGRRLAAALTHAAKDVEKYASTVSDKLDTIA